MIAAALASLLLSQATPIASPSKAPAAQSCTQDDEKACHHPAGMENPAGAASKIPASGTLVRGDKVSGKNAVALEQLLAHPSAHRGKTVTVEGTVRQACTRRGCWMELAPKTTGAGIRVTFKDYAFFVPTDSAGAHAKVEGVVNVTRLSPERAAHYASEGATIGKNERGQAEEVQIVASGVELTR